MEKLSDDAVRIALSDGLPGWTLDDGAIHKTYGFGGFRSAIDFIDRVADVAHEARHHPDLHNHYNEVEVVLSTHSEGGVTDLDLKLARAIDAVADTEE